MSLVGGVFLSAMTAGATDHNSPAVDGINGKISGFGGSLANRPLHGARGSLSLPLQGQFGAQFDGAAGRLDNRDFGSVAGHLFWRNPSQGLIGFYASHARWNQSGGVRMNQVAAEGEVYRGQLTLQGIAGSESGNSGSAVVGGFTEAFNIQTRFFGKINLAYYLRDNLKLSAGHSHLGGRNALALGGEWALPLHSGMMASVFAEGLAGAGNFHGVWVGVKFYFGKRDKTLIQRHRQDDPLESMPESLFSMTNSITRTAVPSASPSPSPPPEPDPPILDT